MTVGHNQPGVWQRWEQLAAERPDREAIVHLSLEADPVRWTRGALLRAARGASSNLRARGVRRGDVCALMIRHRADFYPLYMGTCALGAIPAVLAYPNARLHPEKFRAGLAGMAKTSGMDWLLTERSLEGVVMPLLAAPGSTVRDVLFPFDWDQANGTQGADAESAGADLDAPFLLQHSSGTTGLQKAVVLSNRAVIEQLESYAEAIRLTSADKVVSWLPLYHDMGLIAAFHLPLLMGVTTVQIDPFEWISVPALFPEILSSERGTVAWLPNFAYNVMADRVRDEVVEGIRLDHVRLLINCSEPVRVESHERLLARFQRAGLRREALSACYAMAEATFAVTQTTPAREPTVLAVDRHALTEGRIVTSSREGGAKLCASSGSPIRGAEVQVWDEGGAVLGEDRVGELSIRSTSMFEGYRNRPDKTKEVWRGGWYVSGDLGFRHGGEYFVVGRKKDIIIVAGKNLHPEDIEDVVGVVEGVAPGRVVAFGTDDDARGTEQVCVVAETGVTDPEETRLLKHRIVQACSQIDVTIAQVHLVPPRWLIKSSAGKPSRSANKERIVNRERGIDSAEGGVP